MVIHLINPIFQNTTKNVIKIYIYVSLKNVSYLKSSLNSMKLIPRVKDRVNLKPNTIFVLHTTQNNSMKRFNLPFCHGIVFPCNEIVNKVHYINMRPKFMIHTMSLSQLIVLFSVLHNPPDDFIREIKRTIYSFSGIIGMVNGENSLGK